MDKEMLEKQFPLFEFSDVNEENGWGRVQVSSSFSMGYNLNSVKSLLEVAEEHYRKQQKMILGEFFPYLYFQVSTYDGHIYAWVNRNGRDGTGINLKSMTISNLDIEYLAELNEKVKPASLEPDKYFYCTNCGEVKPKSEYADFVMAATYCKHCQETDEGVAALIKESHTRGFYD